MGHLRLRDRDDLAIRFVSATESGFYLMGSILQSVTGCQSPGWVGVRPEKGARR
jgi:hypothetical protein